MFKYPTNLNNLFSINTKGTLIVFNLKNLFTYEINNHYLLKVELQLIVIAYKYDGRNYAR